MPDGQHPEPSAAYQPPAWLPNAHAQTIYPALALRGRPPIYRRERWTTPDDDFIDLDWTPGSPGSGGPLVVLFHGLEGSSASHYAIALMRAVERAGWHGAVVHFRGCSGTPNRLARAYHSGDSAEIDWILRRMRALAGDQPLFAAGVSLGGNALLKWLGEQGAAATAVVDAAASVCAPYDLGAAGDNLGRGFNLTYTRHFLTSLKAKSLAKLVRFPGLYDARAVRAARTLREFDDVVTAPLHGFRDCDDYWTRAASKPWLAAIHVRTLALSALNDPFLPADTLPRPDEVGRAVTLEITRAGGHAGYVESPWPGRSQWMPCRLLDFFVHRLAERGR